MSKDIKTQIKTVKDKLKDINIFPTDINLVFDWSYAPNGLYFLTLSFDYLYELNFKTFQDLSKLFETEDIYLESYTINKGYDDYPAIEVIIKFTSINKFKEN